MIFARKKFKIAYAGKKNLNFLMKCMRFKA